MVTNHFVVSQRENSWQISFKGDVTAPFTTRDAAIAAAINLAGTVGDTSTEVIVHDADLRSETVWRAAGANLSEDESAVLAVETERERDA
ncbi:DUF2188 domain-containing protein [Devosia sp. SL43]|uniref:DUF2188 domain-containing protein n=1 Tax=Devosia sp. SL43 TaxID=2806348 RepID=UPI001F2BE2D0|nr:DUF2188 domain-containing protein [Devosia sp. SL43]UJW85946.1 DUF2188 domain-containing protein [Devosia sp. SL43]